jgi:hypothetical protein
MWTEDRDFCYITLVIDSKVPKAQVSTYFSMSFSEVHLRSGANLFSKTTVPEIIDPVFAKASSKRSLSMTEYERFGIVFTKTRVYKFGHRQLPYQAGALPTYPPISLTLPPISLLSYPSPSLAPFIYLLNHPSLLSHLALLLTGQFHESSEIVAYPVSDLTSCQAAWGSSMACAR